MVQKLTLLLACCLSFSTFAQLPTPCPVPVPAAQFCADACIQCDFNGYSGTTAGYVEAPAPGVCFPVENNQWLGFIAGATDAIITATPSNCQTGNGLQLALYEACGSAPIACNPGAAGGAAQQLTVIATLTPGKHYFLMVDGYEGDLCDFTLGVTPPGAAQSPAVGAAGAIQGYAVICPGATVTYSLPADVAGASYYSWTFPPDWEVNGQSGSVAVLPAPDGRTLTVTVGNTSGKVSVMPLNACTTGASVFKNVNVAPIPPTVLPPLTISSDSLPFLWQDSWLQGSGVYQATLVSWLGCDSIVRQQIIVVNTVTTAGKVFADIDGNGQFNGSDFPLQGVAIQTSSGKISSTAANGGYSLTNLPPGDTIRAALNLSGVVASPPFRIKTSGQTSGYDFAVQDAGSSADLRVELTNSGPFRPGFQTALVLEVANNSLIQQPGSQASLHLPALLDLVSANPAPTSMAGDTLYWALGALLPGQNVKIQVQVQTLVGTPIGQGFDLYAEVSPLADAIPGNNTKLLHRIVVGSFDPNDKQVDPPYATPAMLAGQPPLEYTVRFQNTGNYPAEIVKITDTLQATLDPASFRFLSASHACTWKIVTPGVIEFTFANINLPDSIHNEPESHGFVKYSVRPRPGLAYGDVVENFADIYFDFNPPVRTNTAGTEVVYFIPGIPPNGATMSSRPNPATYKIFFAWDTPLEQAGTLRLFTINGVFVTELPVDAGSSGTEMYVADRPEGAYVALLEAGAQRYVKVVLIRRSQFQVRRN